MKKVIMIFKGPFPKTSVPKFGDFFSDPKLKKNEGLFPLNVAMMLNRTPEWDPKNKEDLKPPVITKTESKPKEGGK